MRLQESCSPPAAEAVMLSRAAAPPMKLVFLLLLLVASGAIAAEEKKAVATISPTEQDIISLAIARSIETIGDELHVLEETTSVGLSAHRDENEVAMQLREQALDHDPPFRAAVEDFIRKNRTGTKLIFPNPLAKNTQIISREELQKIFPPSGDKKRTGWKTFLARYPHSGGLINVSRPGIDAKQKVAIIYLGQTRDYGSGSGRLHIFRREGTEWVLTDEFFGPPLL